LFVVLFLEVFEFFGIRKEATHVFPAKVGWRLFFIVTIAWSLFGSIYNLSASHRAPNGVPLWWCLLFLAISLLTRPKTLVVNSTGLASYGWYGIQRRFILWVDVSGVASDWEEEMLTQNFITLLWVFMGYSVTVTGRDTTRITHTILLRHQGKFLDDLRQYIPATAFDPGLFDWHP
jgi:hypothetical protein